MYTYSTAQINLTEVQYIICYLQGSFGLTVVVVAAALHLWTGPAGNVSEKSREGGGCRMPMSRREPSPKLPFSGISN